MRDSVPISTGHYYYNVVNGNQFGSATQQTKANWLDKTLAWLTGGLGAGADQMGEWLNRGTVQIDAFTTFVEGVQKQITIPVETLQDFQRALEVYKIYRRLEVMKRSWRGSIFKLDLLDTLPVFEATETDQFGVPVTGIRVGLTYANSAATGDILSKAGMDNPFIGDWDTPKFKYQGPRKLSDIGLNIETSPFMTSNQGTMIQIGKDMNEILNRNFFEGIMGRWQAQNGLSFNNPEDARPSPKLIKRQMDQLARERSAQIDLEIREVQRMFKNDPAKIASMTDALINELEYWNNLGDFYSVNQSKRIERLRNELVVANNVTQMMESAERKSNDAMPDQGNGFLDSVFNTYKTIGELTGELQNNLTGGEEGEDEMNGKRVEFKAKVQYAKATHGAYLEALAIRKLVHNKLKAECQNRMADGFTTMKRQVVAMEARVARIENDLANYQRKSNALVERLNKFGLTPLDLALAARALP